MSALPSVSAAPFARWIAVLSLALAVIYPLASVPSTRAQDEAVDPLQQIAALVPADAATLVTVSTDTESPQWNVAAQLLERGGLAEFVYGAVDNGLASLEIAPANLDPESLSILGGAIAFAAWGESPELTARAAAYIAAADPEAAFRSVVAQLLTEEGDEVIEAEIPGGRIATDAGGFMAVMLLNDTVVFSDAEGAQSVTRLMMGSGPTLADFAPFQAVMAEQASDSIARAYLNGPATGQDLVPLLSSAGLGWQEIALLSMGASATSAYSSIGMTAAEDGFHARTVQLPAPVIGFELPADGPSVDPAGRISADTDVLLTGRDLGANPILVQYVNSLIFGVAAGWAPYDPSGQGSLDEAYAGFEAATGIDLRSEVLDQLQGDFSFAMTANSFDRVSDVDAVLVSEVADRDAATATLNQFIGALRLVIASQAPELSFSEIATGDDILFVLSTEDEVGSDEVAFSFGLIDDELVLSLGRGYERLLLPEEGAALADDPRYLAARAAASDENGPVAYVDVHDLIELSGTEPLDSSGGSPAPSLDGIQALAAVTHRDGNLTVTDVALTID